MDDICNVDGCQVHSYVVTAINELKKGQGKMEEITKELKESTIRLEEVQRFVIQNHEEYKNYCREVIGKLEARDEKQDKVIEANRSLLVYAAGGIGVLSFFIPYVIQYLTG